MSVQTHLQTVASQLLLSESEKTSIRTSISSLDTKSREYFNSDLTSKFLFGSFTRDTILPRKADSKSDVDYMFVFDNSDNLRPQAYLNRIKKFFDNKYAYSTVYQDFPTIGLELNHIRFEIVPSYQSYTWSDDYQIPDRSYGTDSWISSSPKILNSEVINKNTQHNSLIKPLIRLLKFWNVNQNRVLSSFEIEKFVINNYFAYTSNLKTIFFEAINDMYNKRYSLVSATWKLDKIDRANAIVNKTKDYENSDMPIFAESEIKKLIPEFYR